MITYLSCFTLVTNIIQHQIKCMYTYILYYILYFILYYINLHIRSYDLVTYITRHQIK